MTELLSEFEQKREDLKRIVEEHIRNRDLAAEEASKHADERDRLNAKVKELRDVAKQLIAEKSALIEEVQKLRPEKEKEYDELSALRKDYRKLRENVGTETVDASEIRMKERDLQKLIKRQETTELGRDEEKKVVSEIRRLNNEIKKLKTRFESELESNAQVRDLVSKISEKRQKAEEMKKRIEEISSKISQLSEKINTSLQELDEIRRKADEEHELFIKYGQESDREHQEFAKAKNDLRDLEKVIFTIRSKDKNTRKKEKEGELQKKASVLFDKFKNGEQLTTEDILVLQKAGLL